MLMTSDPPKDMTSPPFHTSHYYRNTYHSAWSSRKTNSRHTPPLDLMIATGKQVALILQHDKDCWLSPKTYSVPLFGTLSMSLEHHLLQCDLQANNDLWSLKGTILFQIASLQWNTGWFNLIVLHYHFYQTPPPPLPPPSTRTHFQTDPLLLLAWSSIITMTDLSRHTCPPDLITTKGKPVA